MPPAPGLTAKLTANKSSSDWLPYSDRRRDLYDLNANTLVNIEDVLAVAGFLGNTCTP